MPPDEPVPQQPDTNQPAPPSTVDQQPTVVSSSPSKKPVLIGLALLIVAVGVVSYLAFLAFHSTKHTTTASSTQVKQAAPAQVSITNAGFVPASITVKVGQAVTWINKDSSSHLVASDPYPTDNALAGFNAKQNMSFNDSFSFVFQKAGTYTYHDNLNPFTVKGTVIVKQ